MFGRFLDGICRCFWKAFMVNITYEILYAQTLILVKLILVKIISFLVIAPSPELGSGQN